MYLSINLSLSLSLFLSLSRPKPISMCVKKKVNVSSGVGGLSEPLSLTYVPEHLIHADRKEKTWPESQ